MSLNVEMITKDAEGTRESEDENAEMLEGRRQSSHPNTDYGRLSKHERSKPSKELESSLILSDWDEDTIKKGFNRLECTRYPGLQRVGECRKNVDSNSCETAKSDVRRTIENIWQGEEDASWKIDQCSSLVGVSVVGSRREDVVTVKLEAEGRTGERDEGVLTRAWGLTTPLGQLRGIISTTARVPLPFVQLVLDDIVLDDEVTLTQLGIVANATVHMCIRSTSPGHYPLVLPPSKPPPPTPDVITVTLMDSGGMVREVVVEVVWSKGHKDWLGGYRHRTSGIHYHHAATQTHLGLTRKPGPGLVTRGTQTYSERSLGVQTNVEVATQTSNLYPLVMMPQAPILIPTPKDSMNDTLSLRQEFVQHGSPSEKRESPAKDQTFSVSQAALHTTKDNLTNASDGMIKQQWHAPTQPDSGDLQHLVSESAGYTDFTQKDVEANSKQHLITFTELHGRLQEWHRKQMAQINISLKGVQRKQALVALLDKEIELLRALEAQRAVRSAKRKEKATDKFLKEVSRAQVWDIQGGNGHITVETPATAPTRELASLAGDLLQEADTKMRTHQFMHISHTVQTFQPSCSNPEDWHQTAQELVTLSLRGAELLACGTPDSRLRGLRMRIHSHLLHLLHMVQGHNSSPRIMVRFIRSAGAKPLLVTTK